MKATVFVMCDEGMISDSKPEVHKGHLTIEQVLEVANGLIGPKTKCYPKIAICRTEDGYLITGTNDANDIPTSDKDGEFFEKEVHNLGHVTVEVTFTKIK
jgi:hypothetical protein